MHAVKICISNAEQQANEKKGFSENVPWNSCDWGFLCQSILDVGGESRAQFVHTRSESSEALSFHQSEPVFLNVYGAQASIPRNEFCQLM
jgi:hypothetical protein